MKNKICFAGLLSESNLGDRVILKSTWGLYQQAAKSYPDTDFCLLNLQFEKLTIPQRAFRKVRYLTGTYLQAKSYEEIERNELRLHYKRQLANVNLIVLVGGGLIKYKHQNMYQYLTAIINTAEELDIPLVINGAGVEGYSSSDARCQLLKTSLNKEIVKSITTRDDFDTLTQCYINQGNDKHLAKVADSAVFANEVYDIQAQSGKVFGIGLVRGNIFDDYEKSFSFAQSAELYAQIISEVERRGHSYQLFTNGYPGDSDLLALIKEKLNRPILSVIEPQHDKELVNTLAQFSSVIAARLHANIISYSLNIPTIGLVWNDKLKMFGKEIGHPERFLSCEEFDAKHIVDLAEQAMVQGYNQNQRQQYRASAKNNINYVFNAWQNATL
ncbi:polysaccharide pyruvyl transferase family protein [Oceanisphaera avium]|uniref:Polysaccharide pyruvyl transferase domain-containing protein n=1 Tax=Oceanisphaera avium TaxID=1903694 RepID=A0A1Y0CXN8_9GAMM|nr:polysaccharide pyruvyl transferase family protein [Oceanisphaera avium]ART79677.1 hypothetical protein CBP12_05520 [Oceanisphaera avium]